MDRAMSEAPRIDTSERHPGILSARGDWTLANAAQLLALAWYLRGGSLRRTVPVVKI